MPTISHNIDHSTGSATQRLTLESLPLDIKNEIFSYFLYSTNVKCSTDGSWPGHKYKFETAIMRTNKQLNKDATAYLLGCNEFALIHSKFFALEIDRNRFLPTVAVGKAAMTFKHAAVEATFTHLGTTCSCPFSCPTRIHLAKDRATHALLLTKDFEHMIRELRLAYHRWPAQPILIQSKPGVSPVEYVPTGPNTRVKVVWKINPAHRSDLNDIEIRDRQTRLLVPVTTPMSHGQRVTVLGVDKDLADRVAADITPRMLHVDTVGWDLLQIMQGQKQHLDELTNQNLPKIKDLVHAYMKLANMGWEFKPGLCGQWKTSWLMKYVDDGRNQFCVGLLPLHNLDDDEYRAAVEHSWQKGIIFTVVDCFLTALRLSLEEEDMSDTFNICTQAIHDITGMALRPKHVPRSITSIYGHCCGWFHLLSYLDRPGITDPKPFYLRAADVLARSMELDINHNDGSVLEHSYQEEDRLYLESVGNVSFCQSLPFHNPLLTFKSTVQHTRPRKTARPRTRPAPPPPRLAQPAYPALARRLPRPPGRRPWPRCRSQRLHPQVRGHGHGG